MNHDASPTTLRARHVLPRPKVDLYGSVHKGIRRALGDVLTRLGNVSFATRAAFEPVLDELESVLRFCDQHIDHEDVFIRPLVERKLPGAYGALDREHLEHTRDVLELRAYASAVRVAEGEDRELLGRTLYLRTSHFVAATLTHMIQEEEVLQPVLERVFSTEELAATHGALLASISPPDMVLSLRIMMPAMSPEERAGLLGGARHAMPPAAFDGLVAMLGEVLSAVDHQDLRARLDMAA